MYPSKGGNPYGQQPYGYGQMPGSGLGAGAAQEADLRAFRNHPSQGSQYGALYGSVYGSSGLGSSQQVGGLSNKVSASSSLQSRSAYPSSLTEKSKTGSLGSSLGMTTNDYIAAANHGYSQKVDQFSASQNPDYAALDKRNYGEHRAAFIGRDLQSDAARRYLVSASQSHQHLSDIHDHMDQASLLRQQQIVKSQSMQSGSDIRQAEYFAGRSAHHNQGSQDFSAYGGRADADPRNLSILGGASYGGQHAASLLGGSTRRDIDDLPYAQGSSHAGYVGLPPGRDYGAGKGLRGPSVESEYQGSLISCTYPSIGASMIDGRHDDRAAYRRELERDEERRRELIREKEREREERERERERDRERDHHLRERRDKEREIDRNRVADRRERTPPRPSRDRRGSSLLRDEKTSYRNTPRWIAPPRRISPPRMVSPPHRISPPRGAVYRHRSPVKEKKREYICKVYPFSFVDDERDYLSLSKRYPRLAVSPEFCKVVINWPKNTLNLSLHTPVSFEHGILEMEEKSGKKDPLLESSVDTKSTRTVWNAKVVLMSGISSDARDELFFGRNTDEKLVHFNNILKFAVLKNGRSFMAIGGPSIIPSASSKQPVDDSSLIQSVVRHVKDLTQLDLSNCRHWNRFLEVHYDRAGKDGLSSYKEVTVLYVPDLSGCLPSLDQWRSLWLAHKKDMSERERLSSKQRDAEKKDACEAEKSNSKTVKDNSGKSLKVEESEPKEEKCEDKMDDQTNTDGSMTKSTMVKEKVKEPLSDDKQTEIKTEAPVDGESKSDPKLPSHEVYVEPVVPVVKPGKKRIVRKVIKGKATSKQANVFAEEPLVNQGGKIDVKCEEDKETVHGNSAQEEDASIDPSIVKTSIKKKIVKKSIVGKSIEEDNTENSTSQTDKPEELVVPDDKAGVNKEQNVASNVQASVVKTTGKKKIVRRVIKRKVSTSKEKDVNKNEDSGKGKTDEAKGEDNKKCEVSASENKTTEEEQKLTVDKEYLSIKGTNEEIGGKKESKSAEKISRAEKKSSKSGHGSEDSSKKESKQDQENKESKKDEQENKKDKKEKSLKDSKHESNRKSHKESKEKGSPDMPPKYPGLILQTKRSHGSKIRSTSLSLEGLLDYNDKDIEESTFELSLFAESFKEMLQYQMGCRILFFLEKLRIRHVIKRNERKRQRTDNSEKESEKNMLSKRPKTVADDPINKDVAIGEKEDAIGQKEECNGEKEESIVEKEDTSDKKDEKMEYSPVSIDEPKFENQGDENQVEDEDMVDEEEDPEEIIEEEMEADSAEAAAASDESQQADNADKAVDLDDKTEKVATENINERTIDEKESKKAALVDDKADKEGQRTSTDKKDSVKVEVIDKELLEAFRYFDQNGVGYIKVEDLRCIVHNLGKFLSHKDVKEMTQIALSESSSSARDNRILYKKLARLSDV